MRFDSTRDRFGRQVPIPRRTSGSTNSNGHLQAALGRELVGSGVVTLRENKIHLAARPAFRQSDLVPKTNTYQYEEEAAAHPERGRDRVDC